MQKRKVGNGIRTQEQKEDGPARYETSAFTTVLLPASRRPGQNRTASA